MFYRDCLVAIKHAEHPPEVIFDVLNNQLESQASLRSGRV